LSDTHTYHKLVTKDLPGGDLLIHAGDITSRGHVQEIKEFCEWFDGLRNYDYKIFIPGNHDFGFEHNSEKISEIIDSYKSIHLLQDNSYVFGEEAYIFGGNHIKIYGSPWQPEFLNWAFNLPRNGWQLKEKWSNIPNDTDILITHGPSYGHLDQLIGRNDHLGCELLADRIEILKPKIHVYGHIHSGRGYAFNGNTHFINASVLDERYRYVYKPLTCDWNPETNEMIF